MVKMPSLAFTLNGLHDVVLQIQFIARKFASDNFIRLSQTRKKAVFQRRFASDRNCTIHHAAFLRIERPKGPSLYSPISAVSRSI